MHGTLNVKHYLYISDINECDEDLHICGVGSCVNEIGNYHCVCPHGYMLLPNGSKYISIYVSEILGVLQTNCVKYTQQLEHCCYSVFDKVFINCRTTEFLVIYHHLVNKNFFVDRLYKISNSCDYF